MLHLSLLRQVQQPTTKRVEMQKKTEKIVEVAGFAYKTQSGAIVVSNLMGRPKSVGDNVTYASIRSIKNIRVQAGHTQWIESKAIGKIFNKEV